MLRLAWLAFAVTLGAHDPRGFMSGTVTGSSGAVIPSTPVTLQSIRTGVTAALTGFKSFTRSNMELRIGDLLRIDIVLEPVATSGKIEVGGRRDEHPKLQRAQHRARQHAVRPGHQHPDRSRGTPQLRRIRVHLLIR